MHMQGQKSYILSPWQLSLVMEIGLHVFLQEGSKAPSK